MALTEFELIRRYFASPNAGATRDDVVLGVGDDGAILRPPPGMDLVAVADTLIEGVHFPVGSAPAAPSATARSPSTSATSPRWVPSRPGRCCHCPCPRSRRSGWRPSPTVSRASRAATHVALVGGDTTGGALAVTVQVLGFVPAGEGLRRAGGRPGDWVFVSGTPGDAAAGLALEMGADGPGGLDEAWLRDRFLYPTPRVGLGPAAARRSRAPASTCRTVCSAISASSSRRAAAARRSTSRSCRCRRR